MIKIKEFINKNRQKILLINGSLIIFLLIITIIINVSFGNKKTLEKELIRIGKEFYEQNYYPLLSTDETNREEFLKNLEKTGLNFNLEFLKNNVKDVPKFVNSKTNEECDNTKTYILITPKANYGKTDYDIKVELVCGFNK